ncbi:MULTISPECIES: sensor histidine kinase [Microbacterium]|uniref:histidine kinase n=2 Tax=Microbacterium maritypicum TaxID=33918 RepID=A0AAJ5SLZ7_MICMQ|nr:MULTISPECIES: histidine kinase [Microbacterium]EYT61600.1 histidine kinase [Microbacterium sp. UCD-TDU]MBP5800861.1 two-component sensor histidine kinase [Microbacterium liquefaciens]UTT52203.1 histidine kinase [Microbacterium liquefaciens]WEF20243.1 histidine kinase [Microbacterium liquefaciens]
MLHPVARLLLIVVIGVLLAVAIGFAVEGGEFSRYDLLAIVFYLGLAAFAWHPMTAAFIVMLISSAGVVFTGSGGDLLELAVSLGLVAATCAPWVIITHVVVVAALTAYVAVESTTLAAGGIYGIAGVATIAFLVGVAFRLVAARETVLVAERARVERVLAAIAREDQERIADELHDGIAHDLTLILFHARALPRQPDDAARQVSLTTIDESAEQALQSIQSLLSLMRDPTTEPPPSRETRYNGSVVDAVTSLSELLEDAGIATQVSVPNSSLGATSAAERALIETTIEAVMNIIKHAPKSKSASISVHTDPSGIELVVTNTGPLPPARSSASSGGRGLRRAGQRLRQIGGKLESGPTEQGWELRARVPTTVM